MNRKIVLVALLFCSFQAFGMLKRTAPTEASSALFKTKLPWMKSTSVPSTSFPLPPDENALQTTSTKDLPEKSTKQAQNSSRFTMPKFSKRTLIVPGILGGVEAYHWYNDQIRDEELARRNEELARRDEELAKEQAKVVSLFNELQGQRQEAKRGLDNVQNLFEQTPNEKTILLVSGAYDIWISKLPREELSDEFQSTVDQYIVAKQQMFDRKWDKIWLVTKKDQLMRDAEKIEMDNEFTKMSNVLDNIRKTNREGLPLVSDQFLISNLRNMKKDVLRDKIEQAWWLNALSMPAGLVDKWVVRRNA